MKIFIPTRSRDTIDTVESLHLDKLGLDYAYAINADEASRFQGLPYITAPEGSKIGNVRQAILEQPEEHHIVCDDDLKFYRRSTGVKLEKCTPEDITDMMTKIQKFLDEGYVHGAVSSREGNNHNEEDVAFNTRALRCHFYHAPTILGEGFRFDSITVMEDFHMTLTLLELGYPNVVMYDFAHNQPMTNLPGGCSIYRTPEVQARDAENLRKMHPDFVRVVDRDTSWAGEFGDRKDVRISWKKAYCSKTKSRKLNL